MPAILLLIVALAAAIVDSSETCEKKLDLLIGLDGSSTVCNGNEPCPKWDAILQFSKDLVNSLTIGINDARVACITFSDTTNVEWGLLNYTDKSSLNSAIDNVKYPGGELVDIMYALTIIGGVFDPLLGGRDDVQNIFMKITDGAPNYPDKAYSAASDIANENGIAVFVVCEMPGCTEQHAQALSSPPKTVNETYFLIDDYLQIEDVIDILVKKLCDYQQYT